ncbi:MAG: hypothetical protein GF370_02985 [Candidatus Nealsonbacteria bacterium]|nr:hypothetical protein [Candidatus Nealsonbacteria bacterium]
MQEKILAKEAEDVMEKNGEARGITIKGKLEFIKNREGQEALQETEDFLAKIGHPIKYKEIRANDFYPIGYETLVLLISKRILGFDERKIAEMGSFVSKLSPIVRVFMKYFFSMDLMAKESPRLWRRYYTIGNLKTTKLDKKNKLAVLQIDDYNLHPIHCTFLEGYFANTIQMIVKQETTCKETKCSFKSGDSHEFRIEWK